MSSNIRLVIIFMYVFTLYSCAKPLNNNEDAIKDHKKIILENEKKSYNKLKENLFISIALDYEFNKEYTQAALVYEKLYEITDNHIYLRKIIALNGISQNYKKLQNVLTDKLDKSHIYSESIMQEYVLVSLKLGDFDNALRVAKELVQKYKNSNNYNLLANVYSNMESFKYSVKYYNKSYKLNKDPKVLLIITNIMDKKLNKSDEAYDILNNYYKNNEFNFNISSKLLDYLQRKNEVNKMIDISLNIIKNLDKQSKKDTINKINNLILTLYVSYDIPKAIEYLKTINVNDKRIISLYIAIEENKKALQTAKEIYKNTNNETILGEIAMLQYEQSSKNLPEVLSKFEQSLKNTSNDRYENYYGYLLIDHDININKGIELIKKALKKFPNNYAYQDSLAYGLYKNNQCDDAYVIMKKIVTPETLKNDEISSHWNKIKKCKESK